MKIIKSLHFFICVTMLTPCWSQKEANVWVFEYGTGIDFNYNRFTPFNVPGMEQDGGSASISDGETGQLLFYSDGRNVWNRNFYKMPNGTGLRGGYATAQAALAVPYPGKNRLYYLFTTKSYHDTIPLIESDSKFSGLYYSFIDMQLERGLGDVVMGQKNIPLMELSTNKLTAVPHANGKDYWLITHEWGSNRFVVFPITEEGVGIPEYFSLGTVHTGPTSDESAGWLLPSPNGKMLACAVYGFPKPLELYDFDAANGSISNLRELGTYTGLYGVSFSPDNSKLYFTNNDQDDPSITFGGLYQMDLTAGDREDIIETKTELYFLHETGAGGYDTLSGTTLQLAPDGRLYAGMTATYLDRGNDSEMEKKRIFYLDKPNLDGWKSEPAFREFNISTRSIVGHSFPNFLQSYFNNLEPEDNFFDEEECREMKIRMYPNPTHGVIYFDSLLSRCFFPVNCTIYNNLGQRLKSFNITSNPPQGIDMSKLASGIYLLDMSTYFKREILKIVKY